MPEKKQTNVSSTDLKSVAVSKAFEQAEKAYKEAEHEAMVESMKQKITANNAKRVLLEAEERTLKAKRKLLDEELESIKKGE